MSTDSEMLAEVPLFAQLSDSERAVLAERIDVITVEAGTTMFHHGDPGGTLYVIRSGEVELFFKNDTGERITLETVGAGQFFGELSLLDGGARTSAAPVKERLVALEVDRGDLEALIQVSPASALHLLAATGQRLRNTVGLLRAQFSAANRLRCEQGQRLRNTVGLLRHTASRNPNIEIEDNRTVVMKVADWISEFSGSLPFLFIHVGLFAIWVALNAGRLARSAIGGWDPFPFGLLTMVVSLEAIILSVFVLLSQNRQAARERVRNEIEYQVNLKAELEIAHMREKVDNMYAAIMARLDRDKRRDGTP